MSVREMFLCVLLGFILKVSVGSTCVPAQCLTCNRTATCSICTNRSAQCVNVPEDVLSQCIQDVQVSVNSTGSKLTEGDDLTLECVHNLNESSLMFEWSFEKKILEGANESRLVFIQALGDKAGEYSCTVKTQRCTYHSSPYDVTIDSQATVILVICGVSAVVLVVIMGLAMKFKLKRDNAKHRERRMQRAQAAQGPAPFTPRDS